MLRSPVHSQQSPVMLLILPSCDFNSHAGATARISDRHYARNTGQSNTRCILWRRYVPSSERCPQLMTEAKQFVPSGYSGLDTADVLRGSRPQKYVEFLWTTDPLADAVMDEFAGMPGKRMAGTAGVSAGKGSGRSSSCARTIAGIVPPIRKRSVLGRSRPLQSGRSNISSLPDGFCSACDACVADHLQLARRQQAARACRANWCIALRNG